MWGLDWLLQIVVAVASTYYVNGRSFNMNVEYVTDRPRLESQGLAPANVTMTVILLASCYASIIDTTLPFLLLNGGPNIVSCSKQEADCPSIASCLPTGTTA